VTIYHVIQIKKGFKQAVAVEVTQASIVTISLSRTISEILALISQTF